MAEGEQRTTEMEDPALSLLDVILDAPLVDRARGCCEHATTALRLGTEWGMDPAQRRAPLLVLSGPPGSGKTALIRALASHVDRQVAWTTGAHLTRDGAAALRTFLSEARATDALPVIEQSEVLSGDTLGELALHDSLVVLVTREPARLDPGVLLSAIEHIPCRFPSPEQRQAIWEVHLPQGVPLAGDVDVASLGQRFPMSGGEIAAAVRRALHLAVARDDDAPQISQEILTTACEDWARVTCPESLNPHAGAEPGTLAHALATRERVEERAGLVPALSGRRAFIALVDGPDASAEARRVAVSSGHRYQHLDVGPGAPSIARQLDQVVAQRAMLVVDEAELLFSPQDVSLDTDTGRRERRAGLDLLAALSHGDVVALFATHAFGAVGDTLTRRLSWRHPVPEPEERAETWSALWPLGIPPLETEALNRLAAAWELTPEQISHVLRRACVRSGGDALSSEVLDLVCAEEYRIAGKVTRTVTPQTPTDKPETD